jgi:hypothetical protein
MPLKIVSLDPERHRLGLSLKQAEADTTPSEWYDSETAPSPLLNVGVLEEAVDNTEDPTGDEEEL